MKKIILLLALSIGFFQAYAQPVCTFTHTVSGNTATFTPQPFIVIGTTIIDSLVYDYGDNTGTFNIPLSQISNSHTYAASGSYLACHTYYMHQLGNPANSWTCNHCDSVTIGATASCSTTIQASVSGTTITASATASGGASPYTFSYNLQPGNITNSTGSFTGLAPGTYVVCATAIDANLDTCSMDCSTLTVGNTFPCTTTVQASVSGSTLTANAAATGGTPPYTYSYNLQPGNITNGSGIFTGLANGAYTVCVVAIDAMQNTCSVACDSAFVGSVFGCNTSITAQATSATSISATASASFGTAPYTYSYTLNPGSITNATGGLYRTHTRSL